MAIKMRTPLCQVLKQIGKELTVPVVLGIAGGLWATAETDKYLMQRDLERPKAEFIDRDQRVDLVIGQRIYLAEPNGEYRLLMNSDIYRIR